MKEKMLKESQTGSMLAKVIPGALAASLVSIGVNEAYEKGREKVKKKKIKKDEGKKWLNLIGDHPELAEDYKKNKKMFSTLNSMYPELSDHPEAIAGVLRIAQDYSTGGLDPATLLNLASIEEKLNKRFRPLPDMPVDLGGFSSMAGVAKEDWTI